MTYMWIIVGWISGWIMLSRMQPLSYQPRLHRDGKEDVMNDNKNATVSIIIPARNEENNIASLLHSLKEQTLQPTEIIVVNDGSTDRTAEVAASFQVKVVNSGILPSGWLGKSHACAKGAEIAEGELFVFLDADITLSRSGLEVLLSRYTEGLLSVQPYHQMKYNYEQWSAFFNVIVSASVGRGTDGTGAFGPCIVCSSDQYKAVGGHERVKGEILDHHALGICFAKSGYQVRNYIGTLAVFFRMYPSGWSSLWRGWSKSMASGAAATRLTRLLPVIIWIMGLISAYTFVIQMLLGGYLIAGVTLYVVYVLQVAVLVQRVGNFRWWSWLLYPLPLLFFLLLFVGSFLRTFVNKKVKWKDREIQLHSKPEDELR